MLLWGQTFLRPYLRGVAFLAYWLICFTFTGLAMVTAALDMLAIRRDQRRQRKELIQRAIDNLAKKVSERSGEPDRPAAPKAELSGSGALRSKPGP